MASSNEDRKRQRSQDDNTNPFIAFRRFADEQMSTLFNSVFGLHAPSSSSSPDRATKDYQAWLQEARESRDRIDRETEEMGKIMDVCERAHNEQQEQGSPWDAYMKSMKEQQEQDSAQDDTQRPTHDDEEPLRCPYRPVQREVPVERYGHSTGFSEDNAYDLFPLSTGLSISFPCDAFSILGEQFNSSPITYLLYGPYSPIRLEQHQMFKDQDVHWREAFEDLLTMQSGQDVGAECTNRPDLSKAEWIREMIALAARQRERERKVEKRQETERRTSTAIRRKPGFLDRFADSRQPENDADPDEDEDDDNFDEDDNEEDDDEEASELDLYERFLDPKTAASMTPRLAQSASRSFARLQHDSAPAVTNGNRPSILSTLTTTERVMLPDGTVNTKVVLKKKFSDGREENSETLHTQNPVPQAQSRVLDKGNKKHANKNEANEKKSKGWFWS
ncbi:hypothetical protein ABVK25_005493 [Lepraria finkii]|uniref:Uncharacterized protein n=1 Tax=Lepraria finkii TaxID=1340010 RepID=A0ABR4B930_9LECA